MTLNWLRRHISFAAVWPRSIDDELQPYRHLLRGRVLNAGAGWRDVSHLIDGELVSQDIAWPDDERRHIHIFSPLHQIPLEEGGFDAILCIAVLEHVDNPEEVLAELYRVLRPGGYLVASVPFLQPEHKIPTDYQRYTRDGLIRTVARPGFEVLEVRALFTVYHTLYWIVWEWLHLENGVIWKALRVLLLPPLGFAARHSKRQSEKLASAFQVLARKPEDFRHQGTQ